MGTAVSNKPKNGTNVNKVGPGTVKADPNLKPEKEPKRSDFPIKAGEKVTVPMPEGFDAEKHFVIKKVNFDKMSTYLLHRAAVNRINSDRLVKQATDFEAKADRLEKFGDENTRKKVQKVERLQNTLANLTKQLQEAGIDIKDILAGVTATPATA